MGQVNNELIEDDFNWMGLKLQRVDDSSYLIKVFFYELIELLQFL